MERLSVCALFYNLAEALRRRVGAAEPCPATATAKGELGLRLGEMADEAVEALEDIEGVLVTFNIVTSIWCLTH